MITIIYGRGGTGKSHNAEALCKFYKASRIVDGWSPGDERALQRGDLVLTNVHRQSAVKGAGKPNGGLRIKSISEALAEAKLKPPPSAREMIQDERQRQINIEGYDSAHDNAHDAGEILAAGRCYLASARAFLGELAELRDGGSVPVGWPWEAQYWKPKNAVRDAVRAGALFLAERARRYRAGLPTRELARDIQAAVAVLTVALRRGF